MVFSVKKFFKQTLDIEDISYLSRLLETKLPISSCFDLLSNKKNEKMFEEIKHSLDQGMMIENIIPDYLPGKLKPFLLSLLTTLSFEESLKLSLDFYEKQEESRKSLLDSIAYPLIIFFIAITSLYLFDLYGIDSIFSLIASFDAQIELYSQIRVVFRICINVIYYSVLIIFLLTIIYTDQKRIVYLYIFVSRYFPNSIFNIYYSDEFMSLFLICVNAGYKTREALQILKSMKSKPVISFLAFHLDESLMEGETLKEATRKKYYDSSLSRFIKIANYTSDFSGVITSYTLLAKEKIRNRMKRYSRTIQFVTYLFIGLIVVFIYQILFMPMNAISSL